jgi:hypothetical protein
MFVTYVYVSVLDPPEWESVQWEFEIKASISGNLILTNQNCVVYLTNSVLTTEINGPYALLH